MIPKFEFIWKRLDASIISKQRRVLCVRSHVDTHSCAALRFTKHLPLHRGPQLYFKLRQKLARALRETLRGRFRQQDWAIKFFDGLK
mmetsp:Transcript_28192/g.87230  ORF Transcript_28192/g.87230 Transcript_28192/m.87230 type:complete len:87 (+) Transcript_28192:7340-7600(+)